LEFELKLPRHSCPGLDDRQSFFRPDHDGSAAGRNARDALIEHLANHTDLVGLRLTIQTYVYRESFGLGVGIAPGVISHHEITYRLSLIHAVGGASQVAIHPAQHDFVIIYGSGRTKLALS